MKHNDAGWGYILFVIIVISLNNKGEGGKRSR